MNNAAFKNEEKLLVSYQLNASNNALSSARFALTRFPYCFGITFCRISRFVQNSSIVIVIETNNAPLAVRCGAQPPETFKAKILSDRFFKFSDIFKMFRCQLYGTESAICGNAIWKRRLLAKKVPP